MSIICITQGYDPNSEKIAKVVWHSLSYYYTVIYEDGTSERVSGYCAVLDLHAWTHKHPMQRETVED